MPNQANRSKDQSSIVKPKRKETKAAPDSNKGQSGQKPGNPSKANKANPGKPSGEKSKDASGSSSNG